ncbi:MAG TPA: hypothetical protein PKD86_04795 [Gemmatales bacterium]|nr:hypothetical protein [Gemmatales bacterium]HMP58650.1 hypothetical protein [Gemmatales bacterium]
MNRSRWPLWLLASVAAIAGCCSNPCEPGFFGRLFGRQPPPMEWSPPCDPCTGGGPTAAVPQAGTGGGENTFAKPMPYNPGK